MNVPTLDLQRMDISELREACEKVGFFYLTGHGIPDELLTKLLDASNQLFSLPTPTKLQLMDKTMNRGYTPMGEETLDPEKQTAGDTKEGFYICRDIPKDSPFYDSQKLAGPNVWPTKAHMQNSCEWKQVMEEYFDSCSNVAFRLTQLFALSLDLDEHYFDTYFSHPPEPEPPFAAEKGDDQYPLAALRLLHYSTVQSHPDDGIFGCGAHSDYGMLTLLLTDENPGLEIQLIKDDDSSWMPVPPKKGAFIVNLGDMLEVWTNGVFRSTVHRVIISSGKEERYSAAFFYEPKFDTEVECLSSCCSEHNPPQYRKTTSGQHLLDKYLQTHAEFNPENNDKKE